MPSVLVFGWRGPYPQRPLPRHLESRPLGLEIEIFGSYLSFWIGCALVFDRQRGQRMIVIAKTYDLILWSCNHIGKFPRHHRFLLGEKIERTLYHLLEIRIRAKSAKD